LLSPKLRHVGSGLLGGVTLVVANSIKHLRLPHPQFLATAIPVNSDIFGVVAEILNFQIFSEENASVCLSGDSKSWAGTPNKE
jgi:hypothetical protein